jgi:hypothetical protein
MSSIYRDRTVTWLMSVTWSQPIIGFPAKSQQIEQVT